MIPRILESSVFCSASKDLIDLIRKKNQDKKISFLLPTKYISEEASAVGLLLDHIYNKSQKSREIFRTFFASCHWEAVSGAVKIMRHNIFLKSPSQTKKILIVDPQNTLRPFFLDCPQSEMQLLPQIERVFDLQQAFDRLESDNSLRGIICGITDETNLQDIDTLFGVCKKKKTFTALDESSLSNWFKNKGHYTFDFPPDIYIAGENLAGYQVPYSSFSMTAEIYNPWHSVEECLAHSSTYSGNTLSLSCVYENIKKHGYFGPELSIFESRKAKYESYARHINPVIAWIFYSTGLSPEVASAYKTRLMIQSENGVEEIVDGIAGSGCCLRGHNPSDLIPEVLDSHDTEHNYWDELKKTLIEISRMPYVFPAVSGSTAVDIAVILGLIAERPKKKILTFKDNYSGKSLISLNLSRYKNFLAPFHPLFSGIVELDLFAPDSVKVLEQYLLSGEIALVWFEPIQGQNLDPIPEAILDCINRNKKAGNYLIGIDEILTGTFRLGSLFCSEHKVLEPDLIAISKATSDMVFPSAYVFASERVYKQAAINSPETVAAFETKFVNQLGAHITLHAIHQIQKNDIASAVQSRFQFFYQNLMKDIKKSKFHKEIKGEGLLIYIKLNKRKFPINFLGEQLVEFLMSSYYLKYGKVLFLNSRITPSISIDSNEMKELTDRVRKTLSKISTFSLLLLCVRQIIKIHYLIYIQKVKEFFWKKGFMK